MKTGNRSSPTQSRITTSTLNPTAPPFRPITSYHSHGKPPKKKPLHVFQIPDVNIKIIYQARPWQLDTWMLIVSDTKQNHIQESIDQYHLAILCVSETWLDSNISHCEISIPGYRLLRTDRKNRKGGGVCIYIHSSLAANKLHVKYPRDEPQQAEASSAQKSPCTKTSRSQSAVCTGHLIQAGTSSHSYNI